MAKVRPNLGSVQPLNIRTIESSILGATQYVQDQKIEISRTTIAKQQYAGRWPEEYNSFITKEAKSNLYKDSEKFFRVMHSKPEWYARKFIFRPIGTDQGPMIKEATIYAFRILFDKLQEYIRAPNVSGKPNVTSGHFASNFRIMRDGKLITDERELDGMDENSSVSMTATTDYATRAESVAYHFANTGGIFYYAAQMTEKKYPRLSVRFSFVSHQNYIFGVPRAPGSTFPVLQIGTSTSVTRKMQKPRKETYNPKTGRRRWGYKFKP